ncbi:conjugal transfer protein TraN, partial [Salmonella enterica subsp. enterica serovar Weltevreden]|nr:conjugal transfer protein TraN [Salmonella enterica subsp. enterica serovar Weltevreden]
MKHYLPLLMAMTSFCLVAPLVANDQFNQGMQQGNASKGQGASAIQGFKPAEVIPGYTDSPAESGYYGGVTSSGVDMTSPGSTALNTSEAGKTITESILNTPPDNKPSLDAPFISEGLAMKDKAEAITGGGFDGCVDQPASFTEITIHQCLRDTKIEQYCTRTATITGDWKNTEVYRYVTISPGQFRYSQNGKQLVFSVTSPVTGVVMNAQLKVYSSFYFLNSRYTFMNSVFNVGTVPGATDTFTLSGAPGMNITEGQVLTGSGCTANGNCISGGN